MRLILKLVLVVIFFSTCKKDKGTIQNNPGWNQVTSYLAGRSDAFGFSIGDKGYFGTGIDGNSAVLHDFWEFIPATNQWTQKTDCPMGDMSGAVGLSIGQKGYVGLGETYGPGVNKQFWEFDPTNNTWTRKTDFPSYDRRLAVAFSIGSKGYIGTGYSDFTSPNVFNDFWEYDPSTDTWLQKANYPGGPVDDAIGFVIGNKGYVGTGTNLNYFNNQFYQYDPTTDAWTKKSNFTGKRCGATGLQLNGMGYLICGNDSITERKDLWEYNPNTDTWGQKEDLPTDHSTHPYYGLGRDQAIGFTIGNSIYFGFGFNYNSRVLGDFWSYHK